jgi:hypothetical protein
MLKKLSLAAVISVLAAAPAWAENSCGAEPIAPDIPSAAAIGQMPAAQATSAKHQAFLDVKAWQQSENDYRKCLDSDASEVKRDLANAQGQSKPDKDKIKRLEDQIVADDKASNSRDTEERVVNDYHALQTAFCSRGDVDKSSCPKS